MVLISHNWQKGIQRLLSAPRDLPQSIAWQEPPIEKTQGSSGHQKLFDEYVKSLDNAIQTASSWWDGMIKVRMDRGADFETALRESYRARLAGPAAHPEVVWVIRKYWLKCAALNDEVPETQRVPPEVFLLSWLMDGKHGVMVQVLAGMPYWPIGLDRDGNWI